MVKRGSKHTDSRGRNRKKTAYNNWISGLKRNFGMSEDDYKEMLEYQDGLCAICETKTKYRLCVDHCHTTGRIRGLLCRRCNSALGMLGDNEEGLRKAFEYVKG